MQVELSKLRDAASVLSLSDRVLTTAAMFERRRIASSSVAVAEPQKAAAVSELQMVARSASLFLAAKSCEEPRRVRDVLNAMVLVERGELLRNPHEYWSLKERLIAAEQSLLRTLNFETVCEDPQVLLLNTLRALRAPRGLYQLAIALLNDSAAAARCDDHPTRARVAAAIALGAEMLAVPLRPGWSAELEVELSSLAAAAHTLLDVYSVAATTTQVDRGENCGAGSAEPPPPQHKPGACGDGGATASLIAADRTTSPRET